MPASKLFTKGPAEVLDYQVDWSLWLGTDTISTSAWAIATGLTAGTTSNTTTTATTWVSAGTDGRRYTMTNTIVTAGGRTAIRTLELLIELR
jgi:hypothetical protein